VGGSLSGSLPSFVAGGDSPEQSPKTQQSSTQPPSTGPASPEGLWPPPLLPNQSGLGSPRTGLLEAAHLLCALALQETASLPSGRHHAREPSPICLPIIIHTCEDDFLKHSFFGLAQLPWTTAVNLALAFTEQLKELWEGCVFLGALVLRASSDPSF